MIWFLALWLYMGVSLALVVALDLPINVDGGTSAGWP